MIDEEKLAAGRIPKYANFTNADGECDYDAGSLEQLACLGQDCMFDYCIWRRDQYLDACVEADEIIDRDAWGDVYDFGEMHADLVSNEATDGEFDNATCDAYYVLKAELESNGTFDDAGY